MTRQSRDRRMAIRKLAAIDKWMIENKEQADRIKTWFEEDDGYPVIPYKKMINNWLPKPYKGYFKKLKKRLKT